MSDQREFRMARTKSSQCIASKAFGGAELCAALDREPDGVLGTASIRLLPILLSPQVQSAAELRDPDRPDALALRRARRPMPNGVTMASTGTGWGGQPRNLVRPALAASMDGRDAPPPWTLRQFACDRDCVRDDRRAQARPHHRVAGRAVCSEPLAVRSPARSTLLE